MTSAQLYYFGRVVACLEEASRNYHKLADRTPKEVDPFVGSHSTDWADCDEQPCVQHQQLIEAATRVATS
jgi:hypothetical protein